MEETKPFYQFLYKFVELSPEEYRQFVEPYLQLRRFGKRQLVTQPGEVENYFNFILSGLARKYYKKGAEEIIVQIATEDHIIHAQESFHSRTPSEYTIDTIEPTTFVSITYDDLEKIYTTNSKMEHLGRLVITFTMILRDKWQIQMLKMTPRERFLHFVHNNVDLLQRVPQKYLASYLNIQPETFSRFKHLLREKR